MLNSVSVTPRRGQCIPPPILFYFFTMVSLHQLPPQFSLVGSPCPSPPCLSMQSPHLPSVGDPSRLRPHDHSGPASFLPSLSCPNGGFFLPWTFVFPVHLPFGGWGGVGYGPFLSFAYSILHSSHSTLHERDWLVLANKGGAGVWLGRGLWEIVLN